MVPNRVPTTQSGRNVLVDDHTGSGAKVPPY
jgi:hypothetical protein